MRSLSGEGPVATYRYCFQFSALIHTLPLYCRICYVKNHSTSRAVSIKIFNLAIKMNGKEEGSRPPRPQRALFSVSPDSKKKRLLSDESVGASAYMNRRVFYLSLQAIFNAIIIGLIAKVLMLLIYLITNLSFYGKFSFASASPGIGQLGIWVMTIPIIGGIIVGIIARYGSAGIRGHGIPEAMEQVLSNKSKISPIITILKPLASAIAIGTGGPFGAEGPAIATGGAFGSLTGQIMRINATDVKLFLHQALAPVWPLYLAAR